MDYISLQQAYLELQSQLEEANDIIHAIRNGEVDALVVNGGDGHQLYTLKSADQSYRIFIEQMTESALTLDPAGNILYCNSRFSQVFDTAMEKAIGQPFLNFVVPGERKTADERIAQAWLAETRVEITMQGDFDREIPVQLSLKTLHLDEGNALSVIITDLSELKRSQQMLQTRNSELEEARNRADELNANLEETVHQRTVELEIKNQQLAGAIRYQADMNRQLNEALSDLRESEDNLQSAFNAGDLGSCSFDIHTGRTEISERFRRLYGLPMEMKASWEMLLAAVEAEYRSELQAILKGCLVNGSPIDSTFPIHHLESGDRRWMRVVGKVKKNAVGVPTGIYAVLMDVTDQKQDEQRKNDFIAMVSHELKTPLTSMKGYIQVMQLKAKQQGSSFAEKALTGAERQVNKMTEMINGFLNISRLEAGKIVIDFCELDLTALVAEIIEEYRTTWVSNQIILNSPGNLSVMGDPNKLGHVINNLISNAIKYSPKGSHVFIDCYASKTEAFFTIRDLGMGIEKENLPKLFERFYRVDNPQMATVSGFGIGLYLSSEIIIRHGGKIWAESTPGQGSTFYFSLPLASK